MLQHEWVAHSIDALFLGVHYLIHTNRLALVLHSVHLSHCLSAEYAVEFLIVSHQFVNRLQTLGFFRCVPIVHFVNNLAYARGIVHRFVFQGAKAVVEYIIAHMKLVVLEFGTPALVFRQFYDVLLLLGVLHRRLKRRPHLAHYFA